jgi:hypothetical protein
LEHLGIIAQGSDRVDEAVDGFYEFLRNHPNIRTFKILNRISHSNFSYSSLSLAAPQLMHLTIRSWDVVRYSQSLVISSEQQHTSTPLPPSLFPNLWSLTFIKRYEKDESRKDRYHCGEIRETYSLVPGIFGQLLGQIVRNRVSQVDDLDHIGLESQTMRVPPFRILRLQEGLPSCLELDRLPYATLHTNNGIFREYSFSPQ